MTWGLGTSWKQATFGVRRFIAAFAGAGRPPDNAAMNRRTP
jgi:hypothetical protein